MKKFLKFILSSFLLFSIVSCSNNKQSDNNNNCQNNESSNSNNENINQELGRAVSATFDDITYTIYEKGNYNSKYAVAIYIHFFEKLPQNYLTKADGNLIITQWTKKNKLSIGGDKFFNREELLPLDKTYTECDIDSYYTNRGPKRIVFSNDFRIYYTSDHYSSFEEIIFNE